MPLIPLALVLAPVAAQAAEAVQPTQVIEQTFLKAAPGERANLIRYIEANWFAADARAVKRGLFTSYALLEATDPGADWDVVVAVGYPGLLGYDEPGTAAAFDEIRRALPVVLIDGKGLQQLGRIVASRRLRLGTHHP